MVFKRVRSALGIPQPRSRTAAPVMQTVYHWRCACGSHSRSAWTIEYDAKYAADRHLWGKYQDKQHPTPEVYTTEEVRPY
ncbi:hypothetical protein GCM10010371_57010 [Streptomyces subrutilus]|uniref:Uncharacterized protein n=2 Tax=Streptomyces subrutilus TaxID=36818 RepID=A0A918VD93_9ACTN|nr:hypothetical protein GCM10010371_57010 [Streptomyces subrutilus]